MACREIAKQLNTAYQWLLKLEVSGLNVKRLALAEQALEGAMDQLKQMEKAAERKPEPVVQEYEVKQNG